MIDFEQMIDFDKYHTFVLEYNKSNNPYGSHCVRPTTVTYDYIMDTSKHRVYTLEGSVIAFKHETSISEILMECSVRGISLDFVEIIDEVDNPQHGNFKDNVIVQTIDMHKEKIEDYFEKIEAPKYYMALNRTDKKLKYVVVDRFKEDKKIDFLRGKYVKNAVMAAFREYEDAKYYCEKLNER